MLRQTVERFKPPDYGSIHEVIENRDIRNALFEEVGCRDPRETADIDKAPAPAKPGDKWLKNHLPGNLLELVICPVALPVSQIGNLVVTILHRLSGNG